MPLHLRGKKVYRCQYYRLYDRNDFADGARIWRIFPFSPLFALSSAYFPLQMLDLNQLFVKNRIFLAFFSENIWWVRWKAVLLHPLSRDTPCGAHEISDLWRDLHTDRRSSTRSRCCSCDVIAGVSHQGTRSTVNDQVSFNLFYY